MHLFSRSFGNDDGDDGILNNFKKQEIDSNRTPGKLVFSTKNISSSNSQSSRSISKHVNTNLEQFELLISSELLSFEKIGIRNSF